MRPSVYLDHNATTPLRPEAISAVEAAMRTAGNPSSVHRHGRLARRLVEDAREHVARLLGADPAAVVFTSGGTEANTLALCGSGRRQLIASAVEHTSVLQACTAVLVVPADAEGVVRLDALDALLSEANEPALVSVMLANNETGVLQPVREVATLAHRHGALVHCDAAQAAGKVPVDVANLDVDLLSVSAHKLGGPAGVGALVVAPSVRLSAMLRGGGQERGRRAGSENVIGIAGFGAAAQTVRDCADGVRLTAMRDALERRIRAICPASRIFGAGAARLPNTTCVQMPRVAGETQVIAFDLAGISVSAGAACSSGKVGESHVLRAMGVGEDVARTAIRVSLGWTTQDADVDRFVEVWTSVYSRAQACGPVQALSAVAP
jgi:cysteine desulfurase